MKPVTRMSNSSQPLILDFTQRVGNDPVLQTEISEMIRTVFGLCGISGKFHVVLTAKSENTVSRRSIKFRTADARAIQARACGTKSDTWNLAIAGPDITRVFDLIRKLRSKTTFEFDPNFKLQIQQQNEASTKQDEVPEGESESTDVNTTGLIEKTVPLTDSSDKKTFRGFLKDGSNMVLFLSCIAEASTGGKIGFRGIKQVVEREFNGGAPLTDSQIRGAVSKPLSQKGYLVQIEKNPAAYTLSRQALQLLESNKATTPEVLSSFRSTQLPSTQTPPPPTNLKTEVFTKPGVLQQKVCELEGSAKRYDELKAKINSFVDQRNSLIEEEAGLRARLDQIPDIIHRIEEAIAEVSPELQRLKEACDLYGRLKEMLAI